MSYFNTVEKVLRGYAVQSFWSGVVVTAASLFVLQACQYKKPGTEAPVSAQSEQQNTQGVDKTFFQTKITKVIDGKETTVWEPKNFMCAWASENEIGEYAQYTLSNQSQITGHCNIQFEITQDLLIGRLINPSFPDDKNRWEIAVTFPILSHYYYEKQKDENGRDTNKFIENTERSHWSARPMMKIDLSHMMIGKSEWFLAEATEKLQVYDVEWDNEKGFLGYSVETHGYWFGTLSQARVRFNFLQFDHNPNFKKTPYNDKNSRYMNILHVMGAKEEGVYQTKYAAHWDMSKKHEVSLYNFPVEYRPLGEKVIEDWNNALKSVGALKEGQPGFVAAPTTKRKHAFDLRYPSIIWVSDKKISEYSPLGIGQALADVRNGEILWGGITLYGGALEGYVKMFSPNSSAGVGPGAENKIAKSLLQNMSNLKLGLPPTINADSILKSPYGAPFKSAISKFKPISYGELLSKENLNPNDKNELSSQNEPAKSALTNKNIKSVDPKIRRELYGTTACTSRTFADVAGGWNAAMASQNRDHKDVMQSVVKELISHEYGHFLGLGHQFKENILPADGTVPNEIKEWGYSLAEQKEKATEKNNFSQMSSIMGYRSPHAEVAGKVEEILPGPQDRLVLTYLYNQKYATYKKGEVNFKFEDVPENGIIPEASSQSSEYKTSYFPQCNDWQASFSVDPYCNRFDRGNKASEIVTNYLNDFNDTIIKKLYAFTDSSNGNSFGKEYYLWTRSFDTYGRVRVFYDFMRRKYKTEIEQFRNDEKTIYEFAESCKPDSKFQSKWSPIFEKNPEFKDLCLANYIAINDITEKVKLKASDFTKFNFDDSYVASGMTGGDNEIDYSKWSGGYTELSALPIKLASLYALTSPAPWGWGGYDIFHYSTPDQKYFVGSLYPIEFTNAISSAMKDNLFFASLGKEERTSIGHTAQALGYFNYLTRLNNDGNVFSGNLLQQIRNQTEFNFQVVAIILTAQQRETYRNTNFYTQFTTEIYDLQTNQKTPGTEAYMLPNGRIIAKAENMFLYPFTKFQFFSDTQGYVLAYKLDYFRDPTNPLSDRGIKAKLKEVHDTVISSCTKSANGKMNGLSQYFNNSEETFKGFEIRKDIARDESGEKHNIFLKSVESAFTAYYSNPKYGAKPETCEESLRGMGLIVSAAALLNGYYLPELDDLIQK